MNAEERIREVHQAEVRALRALRLALTAVHDSWQDVITICGLEPDDRDPEQTTRTKAWNVFAPLLMKFAEGIKELVQAPPIGAATLADTIKECEGLLELKRQERFRPLREELERVVEEKRRAVEEKRRREEGRDASGGEK
jgi:hypothetical protein